jgi:pimeloyl-ACP methyl ester carboxylesterase
MAKKIKSNFIDKYTLSIRTFFKIPFKLNIRYKHIVNRTSVTYVLIHGLADTGEIWKPILNKLPKDANYIVIDLLGHGRSKKPSAKVYDSSYQARNIALTCLSVGLIGDYILIGHSFGSIVSIECARLMPNVKKLILCSVPLYNIPKNKKINPKEPETILFAIYKEILKHKKSVTTAFDITTNLRLLGPSRTSINEKNFQAFSETLQSGIINQKATSHILQLRLPITIIYGLLDPLVIAKNINEVSKKRKNITVVTLLSDHALRRPMINSIMKSIL